MKNSLLNIIDDKDVISFDVFDTLLLRNVYKPVDIFKILSKIALDKYEIKDFYNLRLECEKNSRNLDNNFECHYDDIYDLICKEIGDTNVVSKLKKEELILEEKFLIANPFMLDIFKYCNEKNKKIIFISDMYLDEKFIIKVLNKVGFYNYKLYLSNVYKKVKGDGSLYEVAFKNEKINKKKWLHVGDNRFSDYEAALKFGIDAFHYKGVYSYSKKEDYSIFESIILGIQNNYLYNGLDIDYWKEFGVKYVSTIYFGFTKWLYDLTSREDNLFFISRDGYIIEKIYKLFNKDKKKKLNYLYLSRKSLQIPRMILESKEIVMRYFIGIIDVNKDLTVRELLNIVQIDIDMFDNLFFVNAFNFKSVDDTINSDNKNDAIKLLLWLYDDIRRNLYDKEELVRSYLKQEGVFDFDRVNIMDIGWAGSIQESIERIIGKSVRGYYFGTVNLKEDVLYPNKFGYFFDLSIPKKNRDTILKNVMMYEFIFSAPHGTTLGYIKNDMIVKPILSKDNDYLEIVDIFQKAAIDIIKKYLNYIDYFDYLSKDFCVREYIDFLERKNLGDVEKFKDISDDFALGSDKKHSFVTSLTVDDIYDKEVMLSKVDNSFWNRAFYVLCNEEEREQKNIMAKRKLNVYMNEDEAYSSLSFAKIYLDEGNGFSEDNIFYVKYVFSEGKYNFKIYVDKNVKAIRIDPFEGRKIRIKDLSICNGNMDRVNFSISNKDILRSIFSDWFYFNSEDPRIIVDNVENITCINFSAVIELI